MSSQKFASMTAELLARKGTAAPSLFASSTYAAIAAQNDMAPSPFATAQRAHVQAAVPLRAHPVPTVESEDKPHRIMVRVTHDEIERLGIAAIKKGVTRHDIVRAALEDYFVKLAAELPQPCNCMANGNCCG